LLLKGRGQQAGCCFIGQGKFTHSRKTS
jgi:hypothetical protein